MLTNNIPQTAAKFRLNKRLFLGLGLILFIVALSLAYLFYSGRNAPVPQNTYKKGLHNQAYSELSEYKLIGNSPSTGISFSKPVDYKIAFVTDDKTQVAFAHSLKEPSYAPLGSIFVSVTPGTYSKEVTELLDKVFSKAGTSEYKSAVDPLQKFVTSRFSPFYDIKYSNIEKISSSNTKKVWTMELFALPKATVQTNDKIPATAGTSGFNSPVLPEHDTSKDVQSPLPKKEQIGALENYKGWVIFIVGKNASYYLLVYNTDYNWDNNAKVWEQMINSIKIDL
jgi:hypothetical protein